MMLTRTKTHYKIYKFDFTGSKQRIKNEERQRLLTWNRAKEMSAFNMKLISDMCDETFDELVKYTLFAKFAEIEQVEYKSKKYGNILWDSFEIGMDMLYAKYGMHHEHHWRSVYYLVPVEQKKLIEYFDKNAPDWVTTVKKI